MGVAIWGQKLCYEGRNMSVMGWGWISLFHITTVEVVLVLRIVLLLVPNVFFLSLFLGAP